MTVLVEANSVITNRNLYVFSFISNDNIRGIGVSRACVILYGVYRKHISKLSVKAHIH